MNIAGRVISYLLIKMAVLFEKRFYNNTFDPYKINLETLDKIMSRNKNTKFGRVHGFSNINDVNEYKRRIPLSIYKDYEEKIIMMCKGEKNVLTAEDIKYFGVTSGTTGKQKIIPVTGTGRLIGAKYMGILPWSILYKNLRDKWSYGKGLVLIDLTTAGCTDSGVPICTATSGGMMSMKGIIPLIWTTPVEVLKMKNSSSTMYIHLLFALREPNLMYISGVFISAVLDLFRYLESHWLELVIDIKAGGISRNIELDEHTRRLLSEKLLPDKKRADFLEEQFKQGFISIARKIWPRLIYIMSVTGGSFSIYDEKVAEYTGSIPVYSSTYAATEAFIGSNRHIGKQRYIMIPEAAFFEFIPAESMEDEVPVTKCMNELRIDEQYEIVITNYSGLYRYRLGDVIKVVDYYNSCPEIEFLYRKSQLLNMVSEKTSEEHALDALMSTFRQLGGSFLDYTSMADNSNSPGKYIFFIEVTGRMRSTEADIIGSILDKELCKANISYSGYRQKYRLAQAEARIVEKGTFELLKQMATDRGVSMIQYKVPRVLKDKELIEFLNRRICE